MSLSASSRVSLLKEICERLQHEKWALLNLTLSQFGLPIPNVWGGDRYAYILNVCKHASDDTLVELSRHVGCVSEEVSSKDIAPPFWKKRMLRVFISHLSRKKRFAAQLQESLLEFGISGFVAHNDIEPTLEWQSQIETALATADSLVALLHPEFHASNWTDQEIGFAMGRGLQVFAVRFGQDPYGFIGRFQAFSGSEKTADVLARELFEAYRRSKQTQKRMIEVLLNLFEDSGSYCSAKQRIGYLESLESWEPEFIDRLRAMLDSNSQISGAWGVAERVEKLAEKWGGS
jgi:hypothetical protein